MTAEKDIPLIIVSGPTASGKSDYAVRIAKKIGAEVVNIDSVQVYREFNAGAAKPAPALLNSVKHHLIDSFEPDRCCNVAEYIKLADEAIADIHRRGKRVVICGGTTMYITCLLQGLDDLPASDPGIRAELERLSSEELFERLKNHDSESATKISAADRLRMVRALEAFMISGRPASAVKAQKRPPRYNGLILVLSLARQELYERINKRVDEMLSAGLVEETRNLVERYGQDIQPLKSLGYAQSLDYLKGEISLEELPSAIAMHTRRFAKRQMTFWRNEPLKRGWRVRPAESDPKVRLETGGKKGSLGFTVLNWDFESVSNQAANYNFGHTACWYIRP